MIFKTDKQEDRNQTTRPCPMCGWNMVRDTRPDTIIYKNLSKEIQQPGWYCNACGEVILTAEDVDATEAAYFDLCAILPKKETALIDIVERLRTGTWHDEPGRPRLDHNDLREAADEIERMRELAQFIIDGYANHDVGHVDFRIGAHEKAIKFLTDSASEKGDGNA